MPISIPLRLLATAINGEGLCDINLSRKSLLVLLYSPIISAIGNALPAEFSRMVRLALNGEYDAARVIHHKFAELFKLLFVDGNPAGVKAMLHAMGMIENQLRLPLVPTRLTTMEKITAILKELNIRY